MKNIYLAFLFAVVVISLSGMGCSSSKINVVGDKADLNSIVGKWEGSYNNPRTGRTGTISFDLKSGRDSASGNVIMMPHGSTEPYAPAPTSAQNDPVPLKINFVAVSGDVIKGKLDPYLDPTCTCTLETSFEGKVEQNKVEGTFITRRTDSGESSTGTWKVSRVKN